MVALLAAAVVACTSAALTLPATTMTNDGVENTLGTGTTAALAVDPNASSSETAVDSSTPESVAPAVEESAPQSAPETAEESEPASEPTESETVSEPAAQTEETAALPQGAEVPANYTQPYTFRDEENGFTVTVWAPEGAFDEEVTLKAKLLDETDSAYAEAKQELDEKAAEEPALLSEDGETPDYGFAALDIHFENAAGEEIEPQGDVYVAIDADKLLPEDADPDSVMVQHHAEEDNGDVTVETVADTADETDGKIETTAASDDTANVQAAFEVNQFSTFTITWKGDHSRQYFKVTVHYVDKNGYEIQGNQTQEVSISNGQTIRFSEYGQSIEGYTYQEAHYGAYNGEKVDRMVASSSNYYYSTLTFYNDREEVDHLTYYFGWPDTQTADVYLVYQKDESSGDTGGGTGTVTENATVTTGKTAVLKNDGSGNYDLTLSVSGTRGSATKKAAVDVLFIVDRSASMTNDRSPRLQNAKTAMNMLVNSLEGNNNIDAQYSIVTFSGSTSPEWGGSTSDANVYMEWTAVDDNNNVSNSINGITSSGGTDYEAGLDKGLTQLRKARSNAVKVVIFLSDGQPTWSYDYGNGNAALCREYHGDSWLHTCTYQGWVDTLNKASQISCGYFYAIGIGSSSNDYLNDLVNNVTATTKRRIEAASDGSNLTNLFKDITADVTFFAAKDVTITDPLSQYADLVLTNNAPQFTITITRDASEGVSEQTWSDTVTAGKWVTFQDAEGKDQTATARVSDNNRTIYLELPGDYELEPGYTYSISTVITPSNAAIIAGMDSEAAKQTPTSGTGTHADNNEQGFWSNDNEKAKVTFTANGVDGSEPFPKPVIQVQKQLVNISFTKVDANNVGTENEKILTGATFKLYKKEDDSSNKYYYQATSNGDGTYTVKWIPENEITEDNQPTTLTDSNGKFTIYNLEDGTYYLEETKAPDGYQLPSAPITVTIEDSKVTSVQCGATILNKYIGEDNLSFKVTNTTGTRLPDTGSIGTTPFATIGGLLFTACAVGLGYGLRRKRGKEAK